MTTTDRLDRHDRQIAGITKLLQTGMRILVKSQEEQTALRKEVRELAAEVRGLASMQKRTEATLQAFINSMKRGGNGHSKKPVDLS
jgi:hypothetical protein